MSHEFTVLVVDDDSRGLTALTTVLEMAGHRVVCANDAAEAMEVALESLPDMVITDVVMPGVDGVELCRRFREHELLSRIPIFMLTVLNDVHSRIRCLSAGAEGLLSKPMLRDELLATVQNVKRLNRFRETLEARSGIARLMELVRDPVCLVDEHFRIAEANQPFARLMGEARLAALLTNRLIDLATESESEQLAWWLKERFAQGPGSGYVAVFSTRAGHLVRAELAAAPIERMGEPVLQITFSDSDQSAMDAAHCAQAAFALETMPYALVMADADFAPNGYPRVRWVNQMFVDLTGFAAEDLLGRTTEMLYTQPVVPQALRSAFDAIRRGAAWCGVIPTCRADGSQFAAETTLWPFNHKNSTYWLGAIRDISREQDLQAALSDAAQVLSRPLGGSAALLVSTAGSRPVVVAAGTEAATLLGDSVAGSYLDEVVPGAEALWITGEPVKVTIDGVMYRLTADDTNEGALSMVTLTAE